MAAATVANYGRDPTRWGSADVAAHFPGSEHVDVRTSGAVIRLLAARLGQIALTMAILSFAMFLLIGLMPGDPIDLAIAGDPRLNAEDAARLRALHGLDQPLLARYLAWAGALLEGRFGHSRLFAQPVAQVLLPALGSTLVLLGAALALAGGLGLSLGLLAAARRRAAPFVDGLAILAQSAPSFWLGILLIILFAVTLGWLPAGGQSEAGGLDHLRFLVLPVATLAIANLAAYARHAAASVGAMLREPWITAARARGNPERRVLLAHALPASAQTNNGMPVGSFPSYPPENVAVFLAGSRDRVDRAGPPRSPSVRPPSDRPPSVRPPSGPPTP